MTRSGVPKQEAELPGLIDAAKRRRRVWIPLFLLIFIAGVALAYSLPPVYRSTATILVELQEIPGDLVSSTIGGYVETRLGALDQKIRSSESLMKIIDKYDVYPEQQASGLEGEVLDAMRESMVRENSAVNVLSPSGRPGMTTVSFSIAFEHEVPEIAQKVTNEFSELYLAENTRTRVEAASEVSKFLSAEADRLSEQLDDVQGRIARFKADHVNNLPEQSEVNRRMLESTEANIMRTEQQIRSLQGLQRDIETRIHMEGSNRLTVTELLAMRRAELAQAESRYSELHPDVRRLRKEVKELEAQADDPDKVFVLGDEGVLPSNNRANIALQSQLAEVKANIRTESETLVALKQKVDEYEKSLAAAPAVEREYQQLMFEKDNVFNALRTIKQKLSDAELGVEVERQSKAERFTIVQPADLPTEPVRPNRLALVLLSLVLAIGASVGIVSLLETVDMTIHGEAGIESIMQVPPIASIPVIPG